MNTRSADDPTSDRRFTLPATLEVCRELTSMRAGYVERYDLDPCADELSKTALNNVHRPANGLEVPWSGHVFVNPPWSDIGPWVDRAWSEFRSGTATSVTMLLPSDRQGTEWWQQQVERQRDRRHGVLTTHYLPGRPKYGDPSNPTGLGKRALMDAGLTEELAEEYKCGSPPFCSVVLVWARGDE